MKPVVIVSANGEWRAVKSFYPQANMQKSPFGEYFDVNFDDRRVMLLHGGWGKTSAAATTQYVIDQFKPDLLLNLGTCGGFEGRIERGTIILAERTIVYDIIEQMTDSDEAVAHYSTELDLSWLPRVLPFPVLRGLLVSGDRDIVVEDIQMLIKRYDAVAADWESGAIAWVAKRNRIRLLILRGVSDLVGASGGEVYGDYELFKQRTKEIMKKLFEQLPKWLGSIEKVEQGYRGY
ncbi:MAG TPA: 5'-methylthioadenosine/S-adenosylhomocysteine nucleosidase [Anaerolineales bacterium]|nr:5'-methylthioadenosine/S-adenosylhomocysteine nucleosidase [Anaerolineales bacterium]